MEPRHTGTRGDGTRDTPGANRTLGTRPTSTPLPNNAIIQSICERDERDLIETKFGIIGGVDWKIVPV